MSAPLPRAALLTAALMSPGLPAWADDTVADVQRGQAVFAQWCVACHGPGQHTSGTMALFFKYQGSVPPLLEQRPGLSAAMLRVFVRRGISVMPSFRPTEISDGDIDALAAYLASTAARAQPPVTP